MHSANRINRVARAKTVVRRQLAVAALMPNQSLQQTKPPVTVRAYARPAPAVFAAEARVRWRRDQ